MTLEDYLFVEEVPQEHLNHVKLFRKFLHDTEEKNDLTGIEESTDLELHQALMDTWSQINYEFEPSDLHFETLKKIPWSVLRLGAMLNILVSQGILSARNVLTYNDSGGITVKDQDKFGRYMAYFNMLISKYRRGAMSIKRSMNINGGYGGINSEYNDIAW